MRFIATSLRYGGRPRHKRVFMVSLAAVAVMLLGSRCPFGVAPMSAGVWG